jgi:phosphatidylethanolamine N-methyltransferase
VFSSSSTSKLIVILLTAPEVSANPTYAEAHQCLLDLVSLALDEDISLIPHNARGRSLSSATAEVSPSTPRGLQAIDPTTARLPTAPMEDSVGDPDDFNIMEEKQAKRIVSMIEQSFGIELSTDVVIADANVATLTRRVLGARSLQISTHSKVP